MINDDNITQSKIKKFWKNYGKDTISAFANLSRFLELLNSNIKLQKLIHDLSYLRHEQGHVYRIGNKKNNNSHEIRIYICIEEKQKVIYLLEIGDKNQQQKDIKNASDKADQILV